MTSRRLNFDEDTKQFVALYTNIAGEEIEKDFHKNRLIKHFKKLLSFGEILMSFQKESE